MWIWLASSWILFRSPAGNVCSCWSSSTHSTWEEDSCQEDSGQEDAVPGHSHLAQVSFPLLLPNHGKLQGTLSPQGSLHFLLIWLHLANRFKNDKEGAASTHFIASGVPAGLVISWILKSLKWAISVYLSHFSLDFSVHEYVLFFKFCLIWNEKLLPCRQVLCRMGK